MAPRPQTVKALATLARMHMDTEVDDAKKYELKMELDEEIRELKHLADGYHDEASPAIVQTPSDPTAGTTSDPSSDRVLSTVENDPLPPTGDRIGHTPTDELANDFIAFPDYPEHMGLDHELRQQVAPEGGIILGLGANKVDEYGDFEGPLPQTGIDLDNVCPCSLAGHRCQHPNGQF